MAQSVTSLIAASLGITSLAGLEEFANLEGLNLNLNQISDISPLVGLTQLVSLFLHGSQISDISPLAGLTRLEFLGLGDNQISGVPPVSWTPNPLGEWRIRCQEQDELIHPSFASR